MPKPLEEITAADIEHMREEFNKELEVFYRDKQLITAWDRKRIEKVIELMEAGNEYYYIKKYKIRMLNGQKVLVNRKNDDDSDKIIRIVPSEEYFNMLFEAHLKTGHGGRDKMIYHLRLYVYIPTTIISLFPKHCKICKSKGIPKRGIRRETCDYKRGFLHIINMTKTPCGSHKYIMYYQDLTTYFLFLRALTHDTHEAIALELTKIFLEFGGPVVLCTTRGETFTKSVIEALKNMHPDIILLPGKKLDKEEKEDCENRIKSNMITWTARNKTESWLDGLHFVQFNLNNSFQEELDGTPFQAVFKCTPKIGVETLGIQEDLAKELKDEDDVINWQAEETQRKRRRIGWRKRKSLNERKTGEGNSSSDNEERAWCWVCEKDDENVTFLCVDCNGPIHLECGEYKKNDQKLLECKLCLNDQDNVPSEMITVEIDKNAILIKKEEPLDTNDSY